tara:strand:- start:506 stop:1246 length:741 start_codon:yes stop_codon:yes gene_type:complete
MYQEAYCADHAPHEFARYHHLHGCLFFAVGSIEAFLNEQMRKALEDKGLHEDEIFKKLRKRPLPGKIEDWPKELCGKPAPVSEEIREVLYASRILRGEITHPKRRDHSIYRELDELHTTPIITAVSEYMVSIYEGAGEAFPYWIFGWNYVGMNNDPTYPALLPRGQFQYSLQMMGYDVPAADYYRSQEWEKVNMSSVEGYRVLKSALDQTATADIEPVWRALPQRPRLTRRWWDREFLMQETSTPS